MANTFTGSNLITKPEIGAEVNLWGLDLNNNFDLLDQAIDGIATITLTGTTAAITISNGQLSNGRCAVLKFNGALSAPCTVSLPASTGSLTKIYTVVNNCGQSIVLQQALNGVFGATVTVLNGASEEVLCDGQGNVTVLSSVATAPGNFTVNGNEEVKGDLTVDGTTHAQDVKCTTLEGTGITLTGNMQCATAIVNLLDYTYIACLAPYTNAVTLGSGAGTGASLTKAGCSDGCGELIVTTGTSPAVADICTIAIASPAGALNVTFSPMNAAAAAAQVYLTHSENSANPIPSFTLNAGVALQPNTAYAWSYIAIK